MTAPNPTTEAPALPLWSRVIGVITSPRETFASVVAHPRWLGMLLLTTLVVTGGMSAFLATPAGEQALIQEQVRQRESTGQPMSPEDEAAVKQFAPMLKYIVPISILVFVPIVTFVLAGVLFGYGAILGGGGTYKQVLAILAHAGVVGILQSLVMHPVNYVRKSMSSATNLTAFFPMVPLDSFVGMVMGWVELFTIWQIVLVAIGFSVLYRRRTAPIAWTLLGVYFTIAVAVTAFRTFAAGNS